MVSDLCVLLDCSPSIVSLSSRPERHVVGLPLVFAFSRMRNLREVRLGFAIFSRSLCCLHAGGWL